MAGPVRVLPDAAVRVRFLRTEALESYPHLVVGVPFPLNDRERQFLARQRHEPARRDYLGAHWLARSMLGERAGCGLARLRLETMPGERPRVVSPVAARKLSFSIAHADGLAVCAVAGGCPVGVDVESVRNVGSDPLAISEVVCSGREREALRTLQEPARTAHLLYLWSCKEAVAKGIGLGHRLPFASFEADRLDGWRVLSWVIAPHHRLSLAVPAATDTRWLPTTPGETRLSGPAALTAVAIP